jgi:hypothetical protein
MAVKISITMSLRCIKQGSAPALSTITPHVRLRTRRSLGSGNKPKLMQHTLSLVKVKDGPISNFFSIFSRLNSIFRRFRSISSHPNSSLAISRSVQWSGILGLADIPAQPISHSILPSSLTSIGSFSKSWGFGYPIQKIFRNTAREWSLAQSNGNALRMYWLSARFFIIEASRNSDRHQKYGKNTTTRREFVRLVVSSIRISLSGW